MTDSDHRGILDFELEEMDNLHISLQTFMCKWCGTRYCRECLRGEFTGHMRESTICAKCNQKNCQGQGVERVLKEYMKDDDDSAKKGSRSRATARNSSVKASSGKTPARQNTPAKSGKSKSTSGKKNGKKKKKKK